MTRFVDHHAEGTSVGRCVVLPGRQYTPDRPLLDFATQAALAHGWDVRQVWWEAPERGIESLVLVVAGDHVLRVPADPVATAASHEQFVRSFDVWLRELS